MTMSTQTELAIKSFWESIDRAGKAKKNSKKSDVGRRGEMTAGVHFSALEELLGLVVKENQRSPCDIETKHPILPGFFRPNKKWDILVHCRGKLVAVIELKSLLSSFSNNANNRTEEAIGSAMDLREFIASFKKGPNPMADDVEQSIFRGYVIVLRDCPETQRAVKTKRPIKPYEINGAFKNVSYQERFRAFCRQLEESGLYTNAALAISSQEAGMETGAFFPRTGQHSLPHFINELAHHISVYSS